jgi:hypothetical protein
LKKLVGAILIEVINHRARKEGKWDRTNCIEVEVEAVASLKFPSKSSLSHRLYV